MFRHGYAPFWDISVLLEATLPQKSLKIPNSKSRHAKILFTKASWHILKTVIIPDDNALGILLL